MTVLHLHSDLSGGRSVLVGLGCRHCTGDRTTHLHSDLSGGRSVLVGLGCRHCTGDRTTPSFRPKWEEVSTGRVGM